MDSVEVEVINAAQMTGKENESWQIKKHSLKRARVNPTSTIVDDVYIVADETRAGSSTPSFATGISVEKEVKHDCATVSVSNAMIDLTDDRSIEVVKISTVGNARVAVPDQKNKWECTHCTHIKASALQCFQVCDTLIDSHMPVASASAYATTANAATSKAIYTSATKTENIDKTAYHNAYPNYQKTSDSFTSRGWSCPQCTFDNPPLILVCDACLLERPFNP